MHRITLGLDIKCNKKKLVGKENIMISCQENQRRRIKISQLVSFARTITRFIHFFFSASLSESIVVFGV